MSIHFESIYLLSNSWREVGEKDEMKNCRVRLLELIQSDIKRYFPNGQNILLAYLKRPMFRYIFWLRIVNRLKSNCITKFSLAIIPYLILRHYQFKYGIHIGTSIPIGKGLCIQHGDGVYLNVQSIGDNFTVYQGVTLGSSPNKGIPIVEDNVTVYMGAKVFGDVVLKDNCVVGANAVVTHDVDRDAVVIGIPAKRIR